MAALSFGCERGGELSGTCLPVVPVGAELLDCRFQVVVVVECTSEESLRALQFPSAPLGCATQRGVPRTLGSQLATELGRVGELDREAFSVRAFAIGFRRPLPGPASPSPRHLR